MWQQWILRIPKTLQLRLIMWCFQMYFLKSDVNHGSTPVGTHKVSKPQVKSSLITSSWKNWSWYVCQSSKIFWVHFTSESGGNAHILKEPSEKTGDRWIWGQERRSEWAKVTLKFWASSCVFTQLCLHRTFPFLLLQRKWKRKQPKSCFLMCDHWAVQKEIPF